MSPAVILVRSREHCSDAHLFEKIGIGGLVIEVHGGGYVL
jgi:hypothetical protein